MLKKVTFSYPGYFLSGILVLITISTTISAAPRKPVFSSASSQADVQQSVDSVESRLARLERLLKSQNLVDLLIRLDNVQAELQNMRGDIEVINHSLDELKKRQRDLYIDVDRRLVQLERGGKGTATSSNTTTTIPNSSLSSTKTVAKTGIVTSTSPSSSKHEQKLYQQAFNLLRESQYDKSIAAFKQFITAYPKGRYAHIAQYWVGEANYAQQNFKQAITAYQRLISNYSKSPKVAEALLKIGYSYYELKDIKKSKLNLKKLVKLYPETTEASQAKNKLQRIKLNRSKR